MPATVQGRGFLHSHRKLLVITFLFFLVVHLLIFRGVLANTGEIVGGEKVFTSEELVPIFDLDTQFFDQLEHSFSHLTDNHEVRVEYSFLTSWARYYAILPFSVVILNALSAWLLFLSVFLLLRRLWRQTPVWQSVLFSAAPALVIHSILLYSKITHFYTLIFGFSLFSLATTLLLLGLYDRTKVNPKYLVLSAILVLVNPAVHYHVLFYILLIPVLLVYLANVTRLGWGVMTKNLAIVCGVYLVLSVVPYWMFVNFYVLRQDTDLSGSIPVSFATILSSSPSLLQVYCLDVASLVDNFLFGSFIKSDPRILNLLYLILSLFPLLYIRGMLKHATFEEKRARVSLLLTLYLIAIVSVWLSLGYREDISLHSALQSVASTLYASDSAIAHGFLDIIGWTVQVLRFPHRFQLTMFYAICVLMGVSVSLLFAMINARLKSGKLHLDISKVVVVLLTLLMLLPLATSADYRTVLSSGNYSGFLEPYSVPQDLREIKDVLQQDSGDGRLLVLPSVGGGLRVEDRNGVVHVMHDKFYIYYFNRPSLDYALSGSLENKQQMFLLYRAFHYEENWWINVLRNNDVKYVVLNKEVVPRQDGTEYLPGIAQKIQDGLTSSPEMQVLYAGDRYDLFMVKDFNARGKDSLLLDVDWETYLYLMKTRGDLFQDYKVYHTFDLDATQIENLEDLTVMYSDETKTLIDLQALMTDCLSKPDTRTLPFSQDLTLSTRYSDNMFSLFTLLGKSDNNVYQMVIPGMFDTLDKTFVGTDTTANIRIPVRIKQPGVYGLYLRGKFTDNRIKVNIGGLEERVNFDLRAVSTEWDNLFEYEYQKIWEGELDEGSYPVRLEKNDTNPMVIDGIVALREPLPSLEDLPVKLVPTK